MDQNQFLAKEEIKKRIKAGQLDEAEALLAVYENTFGLDVLYYLLNSIVSLERDDTEKAEQNLFSAQQLSPDQFEVLFLLGNLYEKKEDFPYALEWYSRAQAVAEPGQMAQLAGAQANAMAHVHSGTGTSKKVLKVFVTSDNDTHLDTMIEGLSPYYQVAKVVVTQVSELEPAMKEAAICWFDRVDELLVAACNLEVARTKPIVCRLHNYESFTDIPGRVQWERIDRLILTTDHLITILRQIVPGIEDRVQISVINQGIDVDNYEFISRSQGYTLAFADNINMFKNPMMLLQIMEKLIRLDARYKLHIGGKFEHLMAANYWEHMVREMGLSDNVVVDGVQDDMKTWLADKNYIISTSVYDNLNVSIAEAMAMGIKPVIHNFPFATRIWPQQILFNSVDDAISMISGTIYNSTGYRNFIETTYSLFDQVTQLRKVLSSLPKEKTHNIEIPMFEKGALRKKVDQLVNPQPSVVKAPAVKTGSSPETV